jgi:hypothetical protein
MREQVNFSDFTDRFRTMDRDESFSYEGKKALFDYLEEYEDSCGEEIELDVIALCCDFTEYEDLEEFHGVYEESEYPDLDTIRDNTTLIEIAGSDGFIIQDF